MTMKFSDGGEVRRPSGGTLERIFRGRNEEAFRSFLLKKQRDQRHLPRSVEKRQEICQLCQSL